CGADRLAGVTRENASFDDCRRLQGQSQLFGTIAIVGLDAETLLGEPAVADQKTYLHILADSRQRESALLIRAKWRWPVAEAIRRPVKPKADSVERADIGGAADAPDLNLDSGSGLA